jgi:hypothetical protein
MEHKKDLKQIAQNFYGNLYTLRKFNEQIGSFAEQQDKSRIVQFMSDFANFAGVPESKFDPETNKSTLSVRVNFSELSGLEPAMGRAGLDNYVQDQSKILPNLDSADSNDTHEITIDDPNKAVEFFKLLENFKKNLPGQTRLLRQGVLFNLVIYFEALIGELLQFFYLSHPRALPSDGRSLTLADLREIGSIENAEKFLIDKEVDDVMRESTKSQLDYFTKRPKANLDALTELMPLLMEIVQRRNLFVHNDGVVNRTYLSNVSKEYLEKNEVKEDDRLKIDQSYLLNAIDMICLCGTVLIQQCWRKWDEDNAEDANTVISDYIYELLIEKRWSMVDRLCNYVSKLDLQSDVIEKIITINYAIALKEQEKIDRMEQLLKQKDWSSCAIKFHVALYALRDDQDNMIGALRKAIAAEEISQDNLLVWPLFRWFRESDKFKETFSHLFDNDELRTNLE